MKFENMVSFCCSCEVNLKLNMISDRQLALELDLKPHKEPSHLHSLPTEDLESATQTHDMTSYTMTLIQTKP